MLPNTNWRYQFVHGNIKDEKELIFITQEGIELIPFRKVLDNLCSKQASFDFSGSSAGDLVEIINFIEK